MENRINLCFLQKAAPYLAQMKDGGRRVGKKARTAAQACNAALDRAEDVVLDLQDALSSAAFSGSRAARGGASGDGRDAGKKNYALITGASSGIGMEFARQLSIEGHPLILVARRRDRLERLRAELGTECLLLPADLSRREDLIRLCEDLVGRRIDIFINNAGFGVSGAFLGTELMREINMVDVNVTAQHVLFKYVLHRMETEGGGSILNVASSAGLFPAGPFMSGYYATKSYMASLTRGVAEELRQTGSGVYVGCLCPGPVDTEFNAVADVKFALPGITAQDCVEYALRMMRHKKTVIIPGREIRAAVFGQRFLPSALTVRLTAAQQKRKMEKTASQS